MVQFLFLCGCSQPNNRQVEIRLSGAQVPLELTEAWLHDARTPHFEVTRAGPVYLSQNGFANLIKGKCDLACVDRPIGAIEREDLGDRKVLGMRVAFYGFAMYVNPANPLDAVYAGHLGPIFKKSVTDWKDIGSVGEGPIHLYGPRKGTRGGEVLMRQTRVIFDEAPWQVKETDAEIVAAVRSDPLALGFASIGFDQGARYLGLRLERNDRPVFPSLQDIESDRYGLAKVIYLYYADPPNEAVNAALDFLYSSAGRRAIESAQAWQIPRERGSVK